MTGSPSPRLTPVFPGLHTCSPSEGDTTVSMDEQKDLSISEDDAEDVVGGKKKAQKQVSNQKHSEGHSKPMINIQGPTNPTEMPAQDPSEHGVDKED